MRRRIAVMTAVLAAAMLVTAGAASASITVVDLNGTSHTVDLAQIPPDVTDRTYTDPDNKPITITGVSLKAVLVFLQLDKENVQELVVTGENGERLSLSPKQVDGTAFADGPPVFFTEPSDAADTLFLLPQGSKRAQIVRVPVQEVRLRDRPLHAPGVKITASKTDVQKGETVTFTATLVNPPTNADPTFSWGIGAVAFPTGRTVSYRFTKAGTYKVVLTADGGGFSAAQDTVTVTVAKQEQTKSKKNRTGGGTNDSADAPDTGAYDGDSTSSAPAYAPPAPTPAPPVAQSTTTATTPKPTPKKPKRATTPVPSTAAPDAALDAIPGPLVTVSGEVLSDPNGTTLLAAVPPKQGADTPLSVDTPVARTGTPQPGASHFEIPDAVWWLLLLGALVAGGWWLDNARARAPRSLPPVP